MCEFVEKSPGKFIGDIFGHRVIIEIECDRYDGRYVGWSIVNQDYKGERKVFPTLDAAKTASIQHVLTFLEKGVSDLQEHLDANMRMSSMIEEDLASAKKSLEVFKASANI